MLKRRGLKIILFGLLVGLIYFIAAPFIVLQYGSARVYSSIQNLPEYNVGIVLGAGVKPDGTPDDILKDRLITAANLYREGKIQHILVTGDNRFQNYNEPQAMFDYLVEKEGIPESAIERDYAGRRTYDSCARAKEIWGIDKALLISQGYHLSRAIFLCNKLGVESMGYSATLNQYEGELYFKAREFLAIHKSIIDIYIWKPDYLGGQMEKDL